MRIVLVLSSAYIKGDWAKMEMEITSRGNANDLVFIPVLIEPCNIPPFLKDCMFINATCKQDKWWEQFLELKADDSTKTMRIDLPMKYWMLVEKDLL
jgi:hypothetical protein